MRFTNKVLLIYAAIAAKLLIISFMAIFIAEEAGKEIFKDRLKGKITQARAVQELSKAGLPKVLETQDHLKKIQDEVVKSWEKESNSMVAFQGRAKLLLYSALGIVTILMMLLVTALWKILVQRDLIDENKNRILEEEKMISRSRKEAVEIVAHDLRGPLASIGMCFDIINESKNNSGELESFTKIGISSVNTAIKLIEQILDHTKIEQDRFSLEKVQCDLSKILEEQVGIFKALCRTRDVEFVAEIDENIKEPYCDPIRLSQVLTNLVNNALKFSEPGKKIELRVYLNNGDLRFEVKDEGPGIPPAIQEKIFDRYWKDPNHKKTGLGIGLTICKAIVVAHGGKIWVDSNMGQGSSFQFQIPV